MVATVTQPAKARNIKKGPANKPGAATAKRKGGRKRGKLAPEIVKKMVEGKIATAAVDRYLDIKDAPRRRLPSEKVVTRLQQELPEATGLARVVLLQKLKDAEEAALEATAGGGERKEAEDGFVKHAKAVSESRGISYSTWRDAGVPAALLKRAGIPITFRT